MRDISEICAELRDHPDCLALVVWQKADVEYLMDNIINDGGVFEQDLDEIWDKISISHWEDLAYEEGWECIRQEFIDMNAFYYPREMEI
jgi:uncharacterized protein Usg